MTETRRMEDLSIAYLAALAAHASIDFQKVDHDEDSVDCMLKLSVEPDDESDYEGACLFIQLKSTASKNMYSISEDKITYQLKNL